MTEKEFTFKKDADMSGIVNEIKNSLATTNGVSSSKVTCKGIRFFFVEEDTQMLMSYGLFVEGFSPEDWDDDE